MSYKQVVTLVTDNNYFKHTESLIGNLRTVGGYAGDILAMIARDVTTENAQRMTDRGISIYRVGGTSHFRKFNVFSSLVERWDKVLYFDADFIIHSEIQPLFDQIGTCSLHVDFEPFKISEYLSNKDSYHYRELSRSFDLDRLGFNCGFLAFDTRLASDQTYDELLVLQRRYSTINFHTDPGGGDQPIVNIKFYEIAKKIDGVGFVETHPYCNRIASHCTRWHAPWHRCPEYYNNGLEIFERLI